MKRPTPVAIALLVGALALVPLAALADLPGERQVKELVGINPNGCRVLNSGDEEGWRDVADMPTLRDGPASAVIGDQVYLVGGISAFSEDFDRARSVDTVERFDTRTGEYATLPPLPRPLNHVGLAAVGGDLYAIGGHGDALRVGASTGEAWRLDSADGRWTPIAEMPTPRGGAGVAVVGDTIYVVGGRSGQGALPTVESFDTDTGRWQEHADMSTRRDHLAVAERDGRIYALGGRKEDGASMRSFERYDPSTDRWGPVPDAPEPKAGFALVDTPAGLVAAGGEDIRHWTLYGGVFAFDPDRGSWRALRSMPEPRHGFGSAYLNGRLYVFGGSECSGFLPVKSSGSMPLE